MGIISMEKVDHLYWLGRYTERVYTTLRVFFHIYDRIIEQPEGMYAQYCERLNIPNIYTSNRQFVQSYLFGEDNPDSVYSNMKRAYDNAIVLRDELSSQVLSYVQLALDTFESCRKTTAPLLELQQVIDDLLAFWGGADDYVEGEDCRNILKCGKYVERLDLCIRLDYHTKDLEKEYRKEFMGEGQMFYFYKKHAYTAYSWPENFTVPQPDYEIPRPESQTIFD